jgi:hypothetical protein
MEFYEHQPMYSIAARESIDDICSVLPRASDDVARHANIKSTVTLARHDVNTRLLIHGLPVARPWVPAFAGMTIKWGERIGYSTAAPAEGEKQRSIARRTRSASLSGAATSDQRSIWPEATSRVSLT